MKYATFGQRFLASLIDFIVLLPLTFLHEWIASFGKVSAALIAIPVQLAFPAYCIWLHARSGQTLGKSALVIRVVRKTGERIGWREAWLRSSVDVVLSVMFVLGALYAIATIPAAEFSGNWEERALALAAHEPGWMKWVMAVSTIWYWSEMFIMLTNKERRALHDYLAGTVVVDERKR
jgi:uncharacterized RDD family membrane protein YckC